MPRAANTLALPLPALGFLLVFYSNHNSTVHRFELEPWDKQTDGRLNDRIA